MLQVADICSNLVVKIEKKYALPTKDYFNKEMYTDALLYYNTR